MKKHYIFIISLFLILIVSCVNKNNDISIIEDSLINIQNIRIEEEQILLEYTEETNVDLNNNALDIFIPFIFEGKLGYLNNELKIVIEPKFTAIWVGFERNHFSSAGFAIVHLSTDYHNQGIIDRKGDVVFSLENGFIQHIYDDIYHIHDRNANTRYLFKLHDNKIIAENVFSTRGASKDGIISIIGHINEIDRFYFIDFDGNRVLQNFDFISGTTSFFEQRALLSNENYEKQIIDMEGNVVGNSHFSFFSDRFSEGLIPAMSIDGVTGFVNRMGEFEFTIPIVGTGAMGDVILGTTNFVDGYALILINEIPRTWNVINNKGQVVSDNIYVNSTSDYSEGLSRVSVLYSSENETRGEWKSGYINTRGEFIVKPILLVNGDSFRNGYARINYNDRDGLLTTVGNVIWSSNIMQGIIIEEELE